MSLKSNTTSSLFLNSYVTEPSYNLLVKNTVLLTIKVRLLALVDYMESCLSWT